MGIPSMHNRSIRSWLALPLAALVVTFCCSLSPAAEPLADARPRQVAAIQDLVERGQKMELEGRWGDALALYEDALRQHPKEQELERGFLFSRMHYDLARRYNDRSFRTTLLNLSERDALAVYAEVLMMIQSHHVDLPDWRRLVDRGMTNLEVACSDPIFVQQQLRSARSEDVTQTIRELRARLAGRRVTNRHEARDAVADASRFAAERLNLKPSVVTLEFLAGASNALDEYSSFLTGDQLDDTYSQIEGNFVGLGVELRGENGALKIVRVITGSPAEAGGLRLGERILSIDRRDLSALSTEQASNLLQGADGTSVELVVEGEDGQRTLRLRRRQVEVPSVDDARIIDSRDGVAYFKLTCFQKTTVKDVDAALWKLYREGMRSLVIDLRGNPGGLLSSSVEVADRFVEQGTICSTRGRNPAEDYTYSAHKAGTWRVPLVLLIDGESASASEIFAGAIRDHRRGTIVGQRSYGKGSVQGIFSLNTAKAGIRLTTARFYSPQGLPYSRVGVEPSVVVQETARPVNGEVAESDVDAVLEAGLSAARQSVARRQRTAQASQ